MTQEIRQEIITLAQELPDELLPEALVYFNSLAKKVQKTPSDHSSTCDQPEFDKAMQIYKQGSEKYKNALRELA
ncbi:conserved hypothetical protein [Planktothrix serta PCC 8927]|uniref:DUF2281 domain-containing protein n=1 Tax=Planktothrix serta PCC 8927 TaxID=671068 RepID=A0A7Z9BSY6_9CYAN|nr:hypothetical protein [Planktothrix serta]VXD16919.1 conserved hypothetical protein [Planktothrix serta PCC 8927]